MQAARYAGNYSAFLEVHTREEAARIAAETAKAKPKTAPKAKSKPASDGPKKLSYKEKRELETLEARIEEGEARKDELESAMIAQATDYEAVAALSDEMHTLVAQLDADMERWAELAERA